MLIYKKVIPVIEVGVAKLIIVRTTRSMKHHLLPNPSPSYSAKQNFDENSSINVKPAPKSLNS